MIYRITKARKMKRIYVFLPEIATTIIRMAEKILAAPSILTYFKGEATRKEIIMTTLIIIHTGGESREMIARTRAPPGVGSPVKMSLLE